LSVEIIGAVTPIHMIGESHSLIFSNILFRPSGSEDSYLCRTRFFSSLRARQYSVGDELSDDYVDGLVAEGLLDRAYRPVHQYAEPSATFLAGMPLMSPPMVLFAGDLDLHELLRQVGDQFDFLLPDDPGYGVDPTRQIMTYAQVRDHIAGFLAPFCNAVAQLKAASFDRVMIHCLPPRTPDNDAAARWTDGIVIGAPFRAKLTLLANRLLAEYCEMAGIGFIDTWPDLTENGYLRPEFELDGVHINRKSAMISLDRIADQLFDRTADNWNGIRYGHAATQASRHQAPSPGSNHATQWVQDGLCHGQVVADFTGKHAADLAYGLHGNAQARPDWSGRPRAGLPGLAHAQPSETMLADAAVLLGQGDASALLHAGVAHDLTVVSFRPARYAPDATAIEPLPAPPEARRALILLSGGDRISFETLAGEPAPCPELAAGGLVVYDPHRLRPRIDAGPHPLDMIELALAPRLAGQPFRVIWAGLCDWPADPYMHSLSGMKAVPAFKDTFFRERSDHRLQ